MSSRNYVFTLNNWTDAERVVLAECSPPIKYICWGHETGESGTAHLQGYIELSKPMRITGVKRLAGLERAHFERRRGSRDQAVAYCKKEEDCEFVEYGVAARQGRRTDLEGLKDSLDSGATLLEVADDHFGEFLKYERSIRSYKRLKMGKRNWPMEVIVIWGAPGTGKTRKAAQYNDTFFVATPRDGKGIWFDGYVGQETIVLDDFYGWMQWSLLLKLLDRYELNLPVKGDFVPFVSKRVVITSNSHPKLWYNYDARKCWGALVRRISECYRALRVGEDWESGLDLLEQ